MLRQNNLKQSAGDHNTTPENGICAFSDEILLNIANYLSIGDLCHLALVNHQLYSIASDALSDKRAAFRGYFLKLDENCDRYAGLLISKLTVFEQQKQTLKEHAWQIFYDETSGDIPSTSQIKHAMRALNLKKENQPLEVVISNVRSFRKTRFFSAVQFSPNQNTQPEEKMTEKKDNNKGCTIS
jgi:hypothetical protein